MPSISMIVFFITICYLYEFIIFQRQLTSCNSQKYVDVLIVKLSIAPGGGSVWQDFFNANPGSAGAQNQQRFQLNSENFS
jgi:hypothetical protein